MAIPRTIPIIDTQNEASPRQRASCIRFRSASPDDNTERSQNRKLANFLEVFINLPSMHWRIQGWRKAQGTRPSRSKLFHFHAIFTGRNEVLAKVIFLHPSVILFTGGGGVGGGGGGYPRMPCRSVPGGVSQHALQISPGGSPIFWGVSNFSGVSNLGGS